MICTNLLRKAVIQAGCIGALSGRSLWLRIAGRVLCDNLSPSNTWNCNVRRLMASAKMMVDTGAVENRGSLVDILPETGVNIGYASGGCKR